MVLAANRLSCRLAQHPDVQRSSQNEFQWPSANFLAYSCAAARELHPLPCLCRAAKTRKPKHISKSEKLRLFEFNGCQRRSQLPDADSRLFAAHR